MNTKGASRRNKTDARLLDRHLAPINCKAAQRSGKPSQVLGLAEHQHHRIEITGQKADPQHDQMTSVISVAWQSSSAPGSPPGTSSNRTLAPSSLTISTTSAVIPPTRRSLSPGATPLSSITDNT